jgi:hypothetical protein
MTHTHQCGLFIFGRADFGCGHIWTHARDYRKSKAQDHMCPVCGAGPWYAPAEQRAAA